MNRRPLAFDFTITVSSGAGSADLSAFLPLRDAGGLIGQVLVKAPFDSASFDFHIVNPSGLTCYKRTEQVGDISEESNFPVPCGEYDAYISNASHDGKYECEIIFLEVY